jgi:D-amino-acid dehydrogenase
MSRTVIVGGGVIGLACAYSLRQQGEEVTVLEQGEIGGGCSLGNAGWITPSLAEPLPAPGLTWTSLRWMFDRDSPLHIDPRAAPHLAGWLWRFWRHCNAADFKNGCEAWTQLAGDLMPAFDSLERESAELEMHREGMLLVFLRESTMRHVLKAMSEAHASGGHELQPMVGAELHRFEPGLASGVTAGIWVKGERHVRPESLCAALLSRIVKLGVDVRTKVEVTGGVPEGARIRAVRTAGGDVSGDRFLIAAGARSGMLSASLAGVPLPVQAGKGYSITVATPTPPMRRALYLEEARVGCSPFAGGYRLAGTMELSGINEHLVPERVAAIRRAATRYLQVSAAEVQGTEWVGMRPITPDGLPIIGALPGVENVFVATGHGMLGVTAALATGALVAGLLRDGGATLDHSPFRPGRFVGG